MQYLKPDSVTPSALTCWMYGPLCVMGSLIKTFVKAVYNEEGLSKREMEIYFVLLPRDCGKKVAKERKIFYTPFLKLRMIVVICSSSKKSDQVSVWSVLPVFL